MPEALASGFNRQCRTPWWGACMAVRPQRNHLCIPGKSEGLTALGGVVQGRLRMWLCQGHSTAGHVGRDMAAKALYTPSR
jgi:hypothetical protein